MNYLGLDCSSLAIHGALVDADENLVSLHKWSSSKKVFDERFNEFLLDFSKDISTINITNNAAVEAAIFVQNHKVALTIAYVVGAVWFSLLQSGIDTVKIDNRQWKKEVLNKGNATKQDIKQFAVQKWGDKFKEQDYADAACIALWNKRRF
tara:strand:+ start:309 stop:761 length:453 start_codon:yes stop_codon:yes gene_type:complete